MARLLSRVKFVDIAGLGVSSLIALLHPLVRVLGAYAKYFRKASLHHALLLAINLQSTHIFHSQTSHHRHRTTFRRPSP